MAEQASISCCCSLKTAMITYGVLVGVSSAYQMVRYCIVLLTLDSAGPTGLMVAIIVGQVFSLFFMGLMFIPTCSKQQDSSLRGFLIPWIVLNFIGCLCALAGVISCVVQTLVIPTLIYFVSFIVVSWGMALSIQYYKSLVPPNTDSFNYGQVKFVEPKE